MSRLALASLVLGILPRPGAAQAVAGAESPPAPMQQVEVAGQVNERRQDTASKTVIPSAEIMRYGDSNLLDVMKRLPAITVTGDGVRMRGLGNGYIQILLNGEKMPPGFAIETLAPDTVDKIEILRSASAAMSTQAIGGTINIVTKNTVRTPQRKIDASLGTEGGGLSPYLTLQKSGRDGALSHILTLALSQSRFLSPSTESQRDADARAVPVTAIDSATDAGGQSRSIFFTPRLNWKLANGDTLGSQSLLRYVDNDSHSVQTSVKRFGTAPPYVRGNSQTHARSNIVNSKMNWTHRFSADNTLELNLGATRSTRHSAQLFSGDDARGQRSLTRAVSGDTVDQEFSSSGKDGLSVLATHRVVFGWDLARQQRDDARLQTDRRPLLADLGSDEAFAVRVRRLALFVQDEWDVTPRWSVYLGARWETVQSDSSGSGMDASVNRSAVMSPIMQTLWKLPDSETSQLRLALARTYKAPAVGNLNARQILATNNTPSTPDYRGNPELRPELAWGLDLAFEYFTEQGSMFSVSAYQRRISDFTGHRLEQIGGRWVKMPGNEGGAHSRGLELEAKLGLQNLVAGAPAIDLRANLNRNWSSVDSVPGPDNRLDGQTPLSLNLGLDYAMPRTPLSMGGNFGLQTGGALRSSLSESSSSNVQRSLDLYALWKYNKQTQLRLALSNLLHQPLISGSRFDYLDGSSSYSQNAPSRASARLTLEHKF